MDILRSSELIEVPWKNGGGTTREIATGKIGGQSAWRISRADVGQNGDFSDFAGQTRILTVVSGGGMVLQHAGGALDANLWEPVIFDGGLKISSNLKDDGPLTDLNLMFDPLHCTGEVTTYRGPSSSTIAPPRAGITAFHVLAGTPKINATVLGLADTAFVDATNAVLDLSDGDAVLEIRITYLLQSGDITLRIAAP